MIEPYMLRVHAECGGEVIQHALCLQCEKCHKTVSETETVEKEFCPSYLMTHDVDIFSCVRTPNHSGAHEDEKGRKWMGDHYNIPPNIADHISDFFKGVRKWLQHEYDWGHMKFWEKGRFHAQYWWYWNTFYVGITAGKTPNDRMLELEFHLLMAHLSLHWDMHPEADKAWQEAERKQREFEEANKALPDSCTCHHNVNSPECRIPGCVQHAEGCPARVLNVS